MSKNRIAFLKSLLQSINDKLSHYHRYSLKLFLISRIVLHIIGVLARITPSFYYREIIENTGIYWLDFWALYDGEHYLSIAMNGYTEGYNFQDYAFFPFYSFLISLFAFNSITLAMIIGLLISNICLYFSSILLYNIVNNEYNKKTALKSIKYLYLSPFSMILSGIFTESLFLLLILLVVYYAKKSNWLLSGIFALLLSLTKITGMIIMIYILYEYLIQIDMDIGKIRLSIFNIIIPVIGPIYFMYFNYIKTGNMFMFLSVQSTNWHRKYRNPLLSIFDGLFTKNSPYRLLTSWIILITLILLISHIRYIGITNWVWSMFMLFTPMLTAWYGIGWISLPRHILPIFPIYIILAHIAEIKKLDIMISILFSVSQSIIMFIWASGVPIIV